MNPTKIGCLFFALLIAASCGKKVNKEDSPNFPETPRNGTAPDPGIHDIFDQYSAVCEEECHPSVAKLIVYNEGSEVTCTGTLVAPDVVVTSSNCLPRNLRLPSLSCVNNIYAIFPGSSSLKPQRVKCDIILSSTNLSGLRDPALFKSDYAFIRLSESVKRPVVEISNDGLEKNARYTAWKMENKRFSRSKSSVMKKDTCDVFYNSYANPFTRSKRSPMVTVKGCEIEEGSLGAPVISERNEILGLLSAPMDQGLIKQLEKAELLSGDVDGVQNIQHVFNMGCSETPRRMRGFALATECFRDIDIVELNKLRNPMLRYDNNHTQAGDLQAHIISGLEEDMKYIKWNIRFINLAGNSGKAIARYVSPECFKNPEKWQREFRQGWIWRRRLKRKVQVETKHKRKFIEVKLNNKLLPHLVVGEDKGKVSYDVEFNPRSVVNESTSYVLLKDSDKDIEFQEKFDAVSVCE